MDKCGCCQTCGRTEHELCDVSPEKGKYGICGDNLVCRPNADVIASIHELLLAVIIIMMSYIIGG